MKASSLHHSLLEDLFLESISKNFIGSTEFLGKMKNFNVIFGQIPIIQSYFLVRSKIMGRGGELLKTISNRLFLHFP